MAFLRRLLNLGRDDRLSRDIEREMQFHLDTRAAELRAQGMSPEDAALAARRQFGNPTFQREETRDADVVVWLDSLLADVRYGLRALRRTPVFTAVAILSLALGIGANTAIYSLIDAVVLRPLPVPHPEEITLVRDADGNDGIWTNPIWEAVRDRQTGFSAIAAFSDDQFVLGSGGEEHRIPGGFVSGDYFRVFGMRQEAGRLFGRADDVRGCPGIAVLSDGYWRSAYGARGDAVGQNITISAKPFQIVGVMQPGFTLPNVGIDAAVLLPICAKELLQRPGVLDARSNWWLRIIGRRDPTVSVAELSARMGTISKDVFTATLPQDWGASSQQRYLGRKLAVSAAPEGVSDVRYRYSKALMILMGAVGLVLLIACANVANLLLARASAREREVAIRLAVGAARRRLVRQLLTESALLAAAGALLGVVAARWGAAALVSLISTPTFTVTLDTSLGVRVLLFTIAVASTTALLFGLVPAWRATRVSPQAAMKSGGRGVAQGGSAPHSRFALTKSLVVVQVALSLTLLVAAALFVGTLRNLDTLDPGFRADSVLVMDASFRRTGVAEGRLAALPEELLARVRALPGVHTAARAEITPISCCQWNDLVNTPGFSARSEDDGSAWMNRVGPGYFQTMGTRLLAGRDFDASDVSGGPAVAIVNEAFARKFLHAADPAAALGRQFRTGQPDQLGEPFTVVGVVETAKYARLREDNSETAYYAESQEKSRGDATIVIRADGDPMTLVPALKQVLAELHPAATVSFTRLATQLERSLQRERVLAVLSALFGGVALALAMLGLYGVMTYTVARRRNEIGVRIALGADRSRVLRLVLGDVARVVAIGVIAGSVGALASGKLVTSFLYGLTPNDPVILAGAAGVLAAVALLAGLLPALRATRVDPVAALRED